MTEAKSVESRVISKLFLAYSDCEHDFGTPMLDSDDPPIWFTVCAKCDLYIFADPRGEFPKERLGLVALNIFKRLAAVRLEVKSLEKDVDVGSKYKGISHDQVINMLRPLFDKHGIISLTKLTSSESVSTGVKWGDRELFQYRGKYTVSYIAVDSGDSVDVPVEGYADDQGDKGPGKACTYATKVAHLKTFALATGEDDEARLPEDELSELTIGDVPVMEAKLIEKAEELFPGRGEEVLGSLAKRRFHFEDGYWQKIPLSRYKSAVRSLEEKAAE